MSNNPLKQYFRRPAVYLKLPSKGIHYPPGVVDIPLTGELPVYPMTAIDEITIKTPDALFNGDAVNQLIKSCIPSILDPWKIDSIDLDSILVAIKAAAGGKGLEIESECPACHEIASYGINLVGVLSTMKYPDYEKELEINDLKIKFRPLTYQEMNEAGMAQFEVQQSFSRIDSLKDDKEKLVQTQVALKRITELTMDILAQTIQYIETPNTRVDNTDFILEFLKNCDTAQYTVIREFNTSLKEQTELKPLDVTCAGCGHEYKQSYTLNPSDFFV